MNEEGWMEHAGLGVQLARNEIPTYLQSWQAIFARQYSYISLCSSRYSSRTMPRSKIRRKINIDFDLSI